MSATLRAQAQRLEAQLRTRTLPWWAATVDRRHGGYLLSPDEKQLATQSRMIWVFAHAHRRGFGDYLESAQHGVSFLLERFRDGRHPGFVWKTDVAGRVLSDRKILYGQFFAVYALVEYARASGEGWALDEARSLFDVIAERAHDGAHGGWIEHFRRNWRPLRRPRRGLEVEIPGLKSANTHLHAVEALTSLWSEVEDPAVAELLSESIDVATTHFFPDDPSRSESHCRLDWTPAARGGGSAGHNAEFAWLLVEAETALGREPSWTRLAAYLDHVNASRWTERLWWEHAEILAAHAVGLRGDRARYEQSAERLLTFLLAHAIDPADGVWVHTTALDGSPVDSTKVATWKDAYHEVRAGVMLVDAAAFAARDEPVRSP